MCHSVKEIRQQKEHWGWRLEVKGGGWVVGPNLKKGSRQYRSGFQKMGGQELSVNHDINITKYM